MTGSVSKTHIFHYSRRKQALFLLFNIGIFLLALWFTWLIFPEYGLAYCLAITLCLLSILATLTAMAIRHPLAVITPESIAIDFCQPLKWKDITKAETVTVGEHYKKQIVILRVKDISRYKLNFMQWLCRNSEFSAFSIPLYAMEKEDAEAIEKLIKRHVKKKSS